MIDFLFNVKIVSLPSESARLIFKCSLEHLYHNVVLLIWKDFLSLGNEIIIILIIVFNRSVVYFSCILMHVAWVNEFVEQLS
jgi:hypothetical protein